MPYRFLVDICFAKKKQRSAHALYKSFEWPLDDGASVRVPASAGADTSCSGKTWKVLEDGMQRRGHGLRYLPPDQIVDAIVVQRPRSHGAQVVARAGRSCEVGNRAREYVRPWM
jgi:hypothetical protein